MWECTAFISQDQQISIPVSTRLLNWTCVSSQKEGSCKVKNNDLTRLQFRSPLVVSEVPESSCMVGVVWEEFSVSTESLCFSFVLSSPVFILGSTEDQVTNCRMSNVKCGRTKRNFSFLHDCRYQTFFCWEQFLFYGSDKGINLSSLSFASF